MTSKSTALPCTADSLAFNLSAAGIALLCLLHCLALPLLVSSLSLAIPFAESETVHKLLVLIAAPATLLILITKHDRHDSQGFKIVAAMGLALLLAAAFVPALAAIERGTTVAGSVLLASAHIWRARHLRLSAIRHRTSANAKPKSG